MFGNTCIHGCMAGRPQKLGKGYVKIWTVILNFRVNNLGPGDATEEKSTKIGLCYK